MESRERAVLREKRLYEASLSGSINSLNELIKEDGLTLARVCLTCFDETPLHIAAMLGHLDFTTSLVTHMPDLVTELDSRGFSPLHLASVKGYVEIVKKLLLVNSDTCLIHDEDGRTPLHLAVMKGRLDVINELVQVRPEVIQYKLNRGETLLHSCVLHNRLGALKMLVESGRVDDLINVKDEDGNTILHLATILKQMETIKYLLNGSKVKANAVNGNGFTALDIIEHMPRDLKAMEIRESLLTAGALRANRSTQLPPSSAQDTNQLTSKSEISALDINVPTIVTEKEVPQPRPSRRLTSSSIKKHLKMNEEWMNKERDALMVAATVIAAMAYQAGLNPPGGIWSEDVKDPKNADHTLYYAGTSIMAGKDFTVYCIFWLCNTVSFVASLSTILLQVSGLPLGRRIITWILMVAMWVTLSCMAITYLFSMQYVSASINDPFVFYVAGGAQYIWFGLIVIIFLAYIVRLLIWAVPKVQKLTKKRSWSVLKVQKFIKKRSSSYETQGQGQGNV